GLLSALETPLGWELLDFGESRAFAVADHQIAHVYVKRREDRARVAELLGSMNGVERVLGDAGKAEFGLDHERAGDLVAVAERAEEGPVAICSEARFAREKMAMTDVFSLTLDLLDR